MYLKGSKLSMSKKRRKVNPWLLTFLLISSTLWWSP